MKRLSEASDLLAYLSDIGFDTVRVPEPDKASSARTTPELSADASERAERLAKVESVAKECTACKLCERRNSVVFGNGHPDAQLMFIGEGPGAQEDRQGLPFVGPAGELLTKIIQAIGYEREQVYIANMVKCRPPGNRDPSFDEVTACRDYLDRQIDLIQPKVIVMLGRIAAQSLFEVNTPIGRMRGQWMEFQGRDAMVTYHPAALLRNAQLKRPVWEDMQKVRDRLRAYGN